MSNAADCPAGEILSGGGFASGFADGLGIPKIRVSANLPFDENTWVVVGRNEETTSVTLTTYALCIGPSP